MFDWFWEFLYMLSKTIFRVIDGLILCANKLCGIDTINFDGEETDFLSYLFFSSEVSLAFKVSAVLATMLVFIFTVFMIIRSISKDKAEGTPGQIAVKGFKTLLMFFFVPAVLIAFTMVGNAFVNALYEATSQSASTPGAFLFSMFAQDGGMNPQYVELFKKGDMDYTDTALVSVYMDLSNFPFLFSWLAGGVALFGIGSAMLVFVDRVLSLVILYIVSPISISTSVLDDGARFKLWRDQFLSKFIMGYGMILAINIYALVCGLVMKPGMVFFPGEGTGVMFLNMMMKLLVIGGGALTMQKSMALIGNLVAQGAGSNELRDSMSAGSLARMAAGATKGAVMGAAGIASGVLLNNPLAKAGKSILSDALSMQSRHLGGKLLTSLGLDGGKGGAYDKDSKKEDGKSDSENGEKAEYGSGNKAKDAIENNKFKLSFDTDNKNSGSPKKNDTVGNTINGSQTMPKSSEGTNNEGNAQNAPKEGDGK